MVVDMFSGADHDAGQGQVLLYACSKWSVTVVASITLTLERGCQLSVNDEALAKH